MRLPFDQNLSCRLCKVLAEVLLQFGQVRLLDLETPTSCRDDLVFGYGRTLRSKRHHAGWPEGELRLLLSTVLQARITILVVISRVQALPKLHWLSSERWHGAQGCLACTTRT